MKQDDKKIEDIIDKLMRDDSLEQAPLNFTDNVMSKVEKLNASTVTVYKPLIPKYIWWLIATGFLGLVVYLFFNDSSNTSSLSERYNLPEISLQSLEGLSFELSSTLMYATLLLALMVSVQIPLLKHYFNKRLTF